MINSSNIYTILVNEGGKDLPLLDQIKDKKNPAEILYSVYRDVNRQVEKRTYAALGRSLALMEKCYMLGDRNVRTSLELILPPVKKP